MIIAGILITKKIAIIAGAVLITAVALGTALPLTVFKKDAEWKGSDVLDEVPLIDSHNDLPWNLYNRESNQLGNFELDSNLQLNDNWQISSSHTDLPRLRLGKLSGQFWVAYVSCANNYKDAVERTIEQIDVIKRLVNKHPNDLMYVTEADQIMEAFNQKKIASMIEIEGGHSIDSRLSVLRLYYELGVRCMTVTHSCNTPWADASPIDDNPDIEKRGLTGWGKKMIYEMNRLGMIVDLSHVSEQVMVDALETSKAPVIFSHSSSWELRNHHRNVKDHVLLKLKENNGVIMINFYSAFVTYEGRGNITTIANHINHVRDLIGADHVGIGSDYDGVSVVPEGLDDVSTYPALFDHLAEEGHSWVPWTADELKKLAGLNLIRVFKGVEAVRDSMKDDPIIDDPVPYDDMMKENPNITDCRTDTRKYMPPQASKTARIFAMDKVETAEGF